MAYGLGMGLAGSAWLVAQAVRAGPQRRAVLRERLALSPPSFPCPPLWLHAASLGEVGVAAVLVERLRTSHPGLPLLLTTFTETGLARARSLPGVTAVRLPLDWGWVMGRFLDRVRPRALWVVETEWWPNLWREAGRRGVPVALVNARLSSRAAARYRRVGGLVRPLLGGLIAVAARGEEDAERLRALGVPEAALRVCGNLKFDLAPPHEAQATGAALRAAWGDRPVWVAGSVRPREEPIILDAHRRLCAVFPEALLVWAPRHPPRFEAVWRDLRAAGVAVARRSQAEAVTAATEVLLLDTLGELPAFYAAGDVAFVGGTLTPDYGGHSPVEPAALGRLVLLGPHRAHFADEAAALEAAGGAVTVADAEALTAALTAAFQDEAARRVAGRRAQAVVEANRSAAARTLDWLAVRQAGLPAVSGATD